MTPGRLLDNLRQVIRSYHASQKADGQVHFIASVRMVLDICAELNQTEIEALSAKILPHRLEKISDSITS